MTASIKLALNSAVMHINNGMTMTPTNKRIRAGRGAFASKPHEFIRWLT